jgi:CheB methylesterase
MVDKSGGKDFPVVCVGGSAGGLDAYIRLLRHLPADMGVAIVIVNHLRTVATMLHEILPRYTLMPVELITERLLIQPTLRANIDETVLPVIITEQGENRNQCEEQRYVFDFSHGFACR